jgi:hypothetical protein
VAALHLMRRFVVAVLILVVLGGSGLVFGQRPQIHQIPLHPGLDIPQMRGEVYIKS